LEVFVKLECPLLEVLLILIFANTEIELTGCLLQGKAQWVKFAVMDHFVSLVLTVVAVIALSIFYGLAALFFIGLIIVGAKFVPPPHTCRSK
jgi:hypothetical protein